eukprot:scaffold7529_cov296-Prasinococcus_capsulatus_cf.AAC.1
MCAQAPRTCGAAAKLVTGHSSDGGVGAGKRGVRVPEQKRLSGRERDQDPMAAAETDDMGELLRLHAAAIDKLKAEVGTAELERSGLDEIALLRYVLSYKVPPRRQPPQLSQPDLLSHAAARRRSTGTRPRRSRSAATGARPTRTSCSACATASTCALCRRRRGSVVPRLRVTHAERRARARRTPQGAGGVVQQEGLRGAVQVRGGGAVAHAAGGRAAALR